MSDPWTPAPVLLASASPRRAELLALLDHPFEIVPPQVDETPAASEAPLAYATRLARAKAEAVWRPGTVAVGADTCVVVDGQVLGKPTDVEHARRMLRRLSGDMHDVITAVAVRADSTGAGPLTRAEADRTSVRMVELTEAAIDWYLATGEPMDKAGAYGLQGRGGMFVASVTGNPQTVIGLPLAVLRRLLAAAGFDPVGRPSRPPGAGGYAPF